MTEFSYPNWPPWLCLISGHYLFVWERRWVRERKRSPWMRDGVKTKKGDRGLGHFQKKILLSTYRQPGCSDISALNYCKYRWLSKDIGDTVPEEKSRVSYVRKVPGIPRQLCQKL